MNAKKVFRITGKVLLILLLLIVLLLLITSIVYHFTPDKCKLIIIDPKDIIILYRSVIMPSMCMPAVMKTECILWLDWQVGVTVKCFSAGGR